MLKLLSRKVTHSGGISYRGTMSPRAEEYAFLMKQGIDVKLAKQGAGGPDWTLVLRHKDWGEARLSALAGSGAIPPDLLDFVVNLTDKEKADAKAAGVSVGISLTSSKDNVLRDRKNLFRFMRAVMSDDAVVAADAGSMMFWSRAALEDEVAIPGDPDVSALYCIHAVHKDGENPYWLHTHGLEQVGGFDLDILKPSESVANGCGDLFRALAYQVLEGEIQPSTAKLDLAHPGGVVRLVPVKEFHAKASAADRELRDLMEDHNRNRSVVCDTSGGLLGWMKGVRPSSFLSRADTDRCVVHFTKTATELMAQRSRATLPLLSGLIDELAEFQLPILAKIGYETDGDSGGAEHMWFEVHSVDGDSIDGTLIVQPFHIKRMNKGDRGFHPTSRLTEWAVMSPFGKITPEGLTPLRSIREDPKAFKEQVALFRTMEALGG